MSRIPSIRLLSETEAGKPAVGLRLFGRWFKVFVIVLILSIGVMAVGASTPFSKAQASEKLEDFRSQLPPELTALAIFRNNYQVALVMLIPVLGWVLGGFALYNTGTIIAAASIASDIPVGIVLFALFLFPFAPLEFISYSAALTQSYFTIKGIYRRKIRPELLRSLLVAIAMGVILFAAAVIEASFL